MPYAYLGQSGLLVSKLSFGAWITFGLQVDDELAYQLMKYCWENGVNFFDNAETYNDGIGEEVMGRALKRMEKELGIERSDYVVSTKIFWGEKSHWKPNAVGLSRKRVVEGLRASLQRLQLDYVDVVFAHRFDPHSPMEEIVRAFNSVIDNHMAFYWCTSEWPAIEIERAHQVAQRLNLVGPICEQPQYNIFHRQRFEVEYEALYHRYEMGTTIWSALSSGVLTGKYSKQASAALPEGSRLALEQAEYILNEFRSGKRHFGIESWEDLIDRVDRLGSVAQSIECTLPQFAIAWCLKNPRVTTVILGASKVSQLENNLQALSCMTKITAEILNQVEEITNGKPPRPVKDMNPIPTEHQFINV